MSCITPHPSVRCVVQDDGGILLDLRTGKYFSMNRVGAHIWQQLSAGTDAEAMEASLMAQYHVSPEALHDDVIAFVKRLEAAALVTNDLVERV